MALVVLKERVAMVLEDIQARADQVRLHGEVGQQAVPTPTRTLPTLESYGPTTSPYREACTRLMESR